MFASGDKAGSLSGETLMGLGCHVEYTGGNTRRYQANINIYPGMKHVVSGTWFRRYLRNNDSTYVCQPHMLNHVE